MGAGTSRPRKFWVARAWGVWRRDVSNPEVIAGVDGGWDVSSQEVLGREGVGGVETGRLQPRSN